METTGQTDKLGTGTQVQFFLWYCPATIISLRRASIFRQPSGAAASQNKKDRSFYRAAFLFSNLTYLSVVAEINLPMTARWPAAYALRASGEAAQLQSSKTQPQYPLWPPPQA